MEAESCFNNDLACNIKWEQTTEGLVAHFVPAGDPPRAEMPPGVPEGIFRDNQNCAHVLPAAFGLCARGLVTPTAESFIQFIGDDWIDGTGGAAIPWPTATPASASVFNKTPYRQCLTITRWVGCSEWQVHPGAKWAYGLNSFGSGPECVREIPTNKGYSWPGVGNFLNEPADIQGRITVAYMNLFGRVPEAGPLAAWSQWLNTQIANNGTGNPSGGPDDQALWEAIYAAAANPGIDPGLYDAVQVPAMSETICTILNPGDQSPTYTAVPMIEMLRYGNYYPPNAVARGTLTGSWGVCITSTPLCPSNADGTTFNFPASATAPVTTLTEPTAN